MELKYLTVRDLVKDNFIVADHVDTYFMLVDPLTKELWPVVFRRYVENMSIASSFDIFGWWKL